MVLEGRGLGSVSINVRITAVRKLAVEAADNGLLAPELAAGIARIKGVRSQGVRVGNLLSLRQAQTLLNTPDVRTKRKACAIGPCSPPCLAAGSAVPRWLR
ncbi:MAG: phage integrase family protein [Candidatus Sulfotelmatobacter sp.]|nr:phage integrase family protein [Candidatus Sulfotelmatobacter sp.]